MKQEFVRFGPWQILIKVTNVWCSDNKYRTFWKTGEPDTWFSVPGRVKVKGVTVSGFLTFDSLHESEEFPDGRWEFIPYLYRKNHAMLPNSVTN